MSSTNNPNQLIEKFLTHLSTIEKRGRLTVVNYRLYLNKFLNWAKAEPVYLNNINNLKPEDLTNYNQHLKSKKTSTGETLSPATQNYYLIALRSFLKYLNTNGLRVPNYQLIKLNDYQPQTSNLEETEIKNILEACQHSPENELIKQRDLAILELLLSTGLKVSELSRLTRADVKKDRKLLNVISSKGKIRTATLNQSTQQAINNYLRLRHDTDMALFISHDHAQLADGRKQKKQHTLSVRGLQRIVVHYSRAAGLKKKITPSTLRNFFAHTLVNKGERIEQIQTALGHTNILTTRRYTKTKA